MKLLVVEDEKALSRSLAKGLKAIGYAVDCAFDGEEAFYLYECNEYDLIILDLNIPKIDGMELLKRIRAKDLNLCVLILSAKNSVENRVEGLYQGANDYLVKPFDFRELEARISSLLRRKFIQRDTIISKGELRADTKAKAIFWKNILLPLSKKEYGIMEYLLFHQRVVSAEELMEHVWDSNVDLFSSSLRFHMSSLRKKLEESTKGEAVIVTMRGQGYQISVKEES